MDQDHDQADIFREKILGANELNKGLSIVGGESKSFYGYVPEEGVDRLDVTSHSGIIEYEPNELVIRVRAGTPLSEVEQVLASEGQMLAFEPPAYSEQTTMGGVLACGLSGPRRAYSGSVRDFVLGVTLLSGDGRQMSFGGQVMKNVAGYDVSRLMAGSMGTLGVILDASFKVLPLPEMELTLCQQLGKHDGHKKMVELSGLSLPVSGSLYHNQLLYIRLSGNEMALQDAVRKIGGDSVSNDIWAAVRDHKLPEFSQCKNLWRISVKPNSKVLLDEAVILEWGGGLRWVMDAEFSPRERLEADGQATLFRYENLDSLKLGISIFQPLQSQLGLIHKNLKRSFDPGGILNKGRMYRPL